MGAPLTLRGGFCRPPRCALAEERHASALSLRARLCRGADPGVVFEAQPLVNCVRRARQ